MNSYYKPYQGNYNRDDDDEDDYTSGSESESDAGSTETDGTTPEERVDHDGRMQALDAWRRDAVSWINGPGRTVVSDAPGAQETTYGLHNTKTNFVQHKVSHVLMVDSLDRDQRVYPLPTAMKLRLPRVYRNVSRIEIVQIKMLSAFYAFSALRGNTSLTLYDVSGDESYIITIPDGTYNIQQLVDALQIALPTGYTVSYSCVTGRIQICAPGDFVLQFSVTGAPTEGSDVYSNWGLGWNLGFGGAPVDISGVLDPISGAYCATATAFPRLFDDYIYLRLNDTELMNAVDHTDVEDTSIVQDSTGQVAHYFGKLLLNNFGCYAQTFIEAPKEFTPVLGRLERLEFQWCDKQGNVLVGPDAASCDWHMTLRITEIQDRAAPDSSLVRGVRV